MDFQHLRQQLLSKRAELVARREQVNADSHRVSGPLPSDFAEQAVERQQDDVLARVGESAQVEIAAIDRALARIEQDAYGICVVCGEPIDPRRLAALPYADTCVRCLEHRARTRN